jgi:hypothetical protein
MDLLRKRRRGNISTWWVFKRNTWNIKGKVKLTPKVKQVQKLQIRIKEKQLDATNELKSDHRNSSSNIFAEKSTLSKNFNHFFLFRCTTEGIRKSHSKSHYYSILCNMPASPQRS